MVSENYLFEKARAGLMSNVLLTTSMKYESKIRILEQIFRKYKNIYCYFYYGA